MIEKVCKNCKHIVPHVHEFINDVWEYNAKCTKVCKDGSLFTIPDRNTYTCEIFEETANVFLECADI